MTCTFIKIKERLKKVKPAIYLSIFCKKVFSRLYVDIKSVLLNTVLFNCLQGLDLWVGKAKMKRTN